MSARLALLLAACMLAGCDDDDDLTVDDLDSSVWIINATRVPLELRVDGSSIFNVGVGRVSTQLRLSSGRHEFQFVGAPGLSTRLSVNLDPDVTTAAVVFPSTPNGAASGIVARALADTGRVVPAGRSKLRVANLATTRVEVDIWLTQPDNPTPVRVTTRVPFLSVSPYLESDAGLWEVFITPVGSARRLLSTGTIAIPSGERRTVVLVDSAGVLRLRVVGGGELLRR